MQNVCCIGFLYSLADHDRQTYYLYSETQTTMHYNSRTHEEMRYWTWTFIQCAQKLLEFAEITQITAITPFKVIQGHRFWYQSKAHIHFLLVICTNLPSILHRFRYIAVDRSKIALGYTPLVFNSPGGGVPLGRSPWNFQWVAKVPNAVEIWPKLSTAWVGRTNVTDRQTTDKRTGDSK